MIKKLFSRTFLTILIFLIEFVLIIVGITLLESYYIPVSIVGRILAVFIILHIIYKKENPEYKLPWLFLIALLPLFGVVIYAFFGNERMMKRSFLRYKSAYEKINETYKLLPNENEDKEINGFLKEKYGIEKYIENSAHMKGYIGSKVDYYGEGALFFDALIKDLKSAKSFIFMEYFILSKGYMWDTIHGILLEKVKQGVEVRILYDDMGTLGTLKPSFCRKLNKEGIKTRKFNKIYPIIAVVFNNRDHRKITVIDGKIGYTGGLNIADEYINKEERFGHWKDTAIRIEGGAVNNLTSLFLMDYDISSKTPCDYTKYFANDEDAFENTGYVVPFGDGPRPFYKNLIGQENYLKLIRSAKKYIWISTPYLIIDYALRTALQSAAQSGIDVRLILPGVPDKKIIYNLSRSNYQSLLGSGVKIYEYSPGFIHAKMAVVDDELAFVGTINLDYRSLVHHFECGATMYKCPCIKDIKDDFEKTFEECRVVPENFNQRFITKIFNSVLSLFSPLL